MTIDVLADSLNIIGGVSLDVPLKRGIKGVDNKTSPTLLIRRVILEQVVGRYFIYA
jgi:hypothetical protein